MTYVAELEAVRKPIFDAGITVPIGWPGRTFDPTVYAPKTGDKSNPAKWILFSRRTVASSELTFQLRRRQGTVICECFIEPIVDEEELASVIDTLEAAYNGASTEAVTFHLSRAISDPIGLDSGWWRVDWRLPYEIHEVLVDLSFPVSSPVGDPADPLEGKYVVWQADGTATGDAGDIMMKVTEGGVTKTITLIDFSVVPAP